MGKFRDLFIKPSQPALVPKVNIFSSAEKPLIDYFAKENRAEKITYSGIGASKYGAGYPPTIYDSPIAAFRAYPLIYSVITAISDAEAGLGVKVYEVTGGEKVEVTDHPFYTLFSNPNPFQGSFEFMEELQQSLDTCGNAFIAKEPVAGGLELYLLNPKYVGIIPDAKTRIKVYRYYINGQSIDYKPEEVIHIKYSDPEDPYFGLPPLATASDVITFEKNRLKFINQYFVNGAIPVGVLETEQVIGDTILKKVRREWTTLHQGVSNAHKVGILQGGLKYRAVTSPIKDLDFPGLKKLSKEDILSIYKVPESILGSQEGTGGREGKDAITAFWRQCIIPRLKRIESGMNRGLKIEMFGNGQFVFEFNLKDVVALQDDKESVARYLRELVASSILTPNEGRAVIGMPKSDDPFADKLMVSNSVFGNALIPVDQIGAQGPGSTEEKPAAKPTKPGDKKPKEGAPTKPASKKP